MKHGWLQKWQVRGLALGTVVLGLLTLEAPKAMAQLDGAAGTNAVNSLNGNMQYAGNTLQPLMIAIILIMGAIGVYYRFFRKAKVGT